MSGVLASDYTAAHLANVLGALGVGLSDVTGSAVMSATGLDETAAAALLTVAARPGQPISDLAAGLGITHSGAVRTADRLQDLGVVERYHLAADRRITRLKLTSHGAALADQALSARRTALAGLLERVDQAAIPALSQAIEVILRGLPRTRHDAWHICRLCEHAVCHGTACPVGSAVPEASGRPAITGRRDDQLP
jgi:DNA-binding MarR family transcriptional regulator